MLVYLLLDQDTTPLTVTALHGKGIGPVELISSGNVVPMEVQKAFHRAALASYNLLMKNGDQISYNMFTYELEESISERIYGGSGALAFAIASMCKMLGKECKEVIGATGVVDIEKGTVERIGAINEKLSHVIESSTKFSTIFYPLDNDSEIQPELRKEAQNQGIELKPVQTLHEVYQALFGKDSRPSKISKYSKKRVGVITFSVILFALYFIYGISSHAVAIYFLENEYFLAARWHLRLAGSVIFYNREVRKILKEFESPIETQPVMTVRFSSGKEESYPIDRVPPEFRFSDLDSFAFRIYPSEPLYVYILQSEDPWTYKLLYPTQGQTIPIQSRTSIPGKGIFFLLNGKAGNRDLFLVLSRWRCRVLESVISHQDQGRRLPFDLGRYQLDEMSVQLKKVSILFAK